MDGEPPQIPESDINPNKSKNKFAARIGGTAAAAVLTAALYLGLGGGKSKDSHVDPSASLNPGLPPATQKANESQPPIKLVDTSIPSEKDTIKPNVLSTGLVSGIKDEEYKLITSAEEFAKIKDQILTANPDMARLHPNDPLVKGVQFDPDTQVAVLVNLGDQKGPYYSVDGVSAVKVLDSKGNTTIQIKPEATVFGDFSHNGAPVDVPKDVQEARASDANKSSEPYGLAIFPKQTEGQHYVPFTLAPISENQTSKPIY